MVFSLSHAMEQNEFVSNHRRNVYMFILWQVKFVLCLFARFFCVICDIKRKLYNCPSPYVGCCWHLCWSPTYLSTNNFECIGNEIVFAIISQKIEIRNLDAHAANFERIVRDNYFGKNKLNINIFSCYIWVTWNWTNRF